MMWGDSSVSPDTRVGRAGLAVAFWLLRRVYRGSLRAWYRTNYRPAGNFEYGSESEDVTLNFAPEMVIHGRSAMHEQLDTMLNAAQQELAQHPERNVWRIGQIRLRMRTGVAHQRDQLRMIRRNEDGSVMKESA